MSLGWWIAKHGGGDCAERIDQGGIELLAAPVTGHLHGGVGPLGTVEHLDGIGKMKKAHREGYGFATDTARDPFAVPSREEVLERVSYVGAETDSLCHPPSREAVGQHAPLDCRASRYDHVGGEAHTVHSRFADARVAEHEPEHRKAGQVDKVAIPAVGDVVTKPGRQFGCVRDAADPAESGHVVERATLLAIETDVFAETSGD